MEPVTYASIVFIDKRPRGRPKKYQTDQERIQAQQEYHKKHRSKDIYKQYQKEYYLKYRHAAQQLEKIRQMAYDIPTFQ